MIRSATVVGCGGGFGRAMLAWLGRRGVTLRGVDLLPPSSRPDAVSDYVQADARDCDWLALGAAEPGRLILLCVPQDVVLAAFDRLLPALGRDTLAADIVSVKSRVAAAFSSRSTRGQYVSLHPMFGPTSDIRGRNVVSIPLADGSLVHEMERLLSAGGANVCRMTADEHDRGVAVTQVMVHAALLAVGLASRDANLPATMTAAVTTPVSRVLQALLARLCSGDPSLYAHIQRDNPHAADARRSLRDALRRLDAAAAGEPDPVALENLIASAAPNRTADLCSLAEQIAEITREAPRRTGPPG